MNLEVNRWAISRAQFLADRRRLRLEVLLTLALPRLWWAGLMLVALPIYAYFVGASFWSVSICLLLFLPVAVVWTFRQEWSIRLEQLDREARDELDIFSDRAERYLVEVRYLDGMALTGRDTGVFWFEGGKMLFMGLHSDFSLTSTSFKLAARRSWMEFLGIGTSVLELPQHGVRGPRSIVIVDIEGSRRTASSSTGLVKEIEEFVGARVDISPAKLPPFELGPGAGAIVVPMAGLIKPSLFIDGEFRKELAIWICLLTLTGPFLAIGGLTWALVLISVALVMRPSLRHPWLWLQAQYEWAIVWARYLTKSR